MLSVSTFVEICFLSIERVVVGETGPLVLTYAPKSEVLVAAPTHTVTDMLAEWSDSGSREALDKLMPIVYDELHRQAARYLRHEREGHTLQTTALVNEAYLRLIGQNEIRWQNRAHFFGIAAE